MGYVADRTTFIRMMIHDYAEQLEFPPLFLKPSERNADGKFAKRKGRLSEGEYQLRVWGSGGSHCWIVEAEKDKNSLFFRKGWPEFLEDNNVRFADVLRFFYKGGNKFRVKIYDPSGLLRNMTLSKDTVVSEGSKGGNGEGEDEPMSMDLNGDDGEDHDHPFSMDLDEPSIFYVNGNGECHLEVGGRHEKEKLWSRGPAKEEDLDCMRVLKEKEKVIHDCAAPTQMGNLELDFSATIGEIELDAAGPSQKERFPRFKEKKERHDFPTQTWKGSLDLDTSATDMRGESEQRTGGQTQKEGSSLFDEERETHEFAPTIRKESLGLEFSARKGESKQGMGEQIQKESLSRVEEGKEHVKESSVLPPFSSTNTHFSVTWQPTWQHYLTIPKEIAEEKDLRSKSQLVIRDHKGMIWFMKLSTDEDGNINIIDGWSKFCRGFGLKEGDTCTFEFFSGRIVHVHISATR